MEFCLGGSVADLLDATERTLAEPQVNIYIFYSCIRVYVSVCMSVCVYVCLYVCVSLSGCGFGVLPGRHGADAGGAAGNLYVFRRLFVYLVGCVSVCVHVRAHPSINLTQTHMTLYIYQHQHHLKK